MMKDGRDILEVFKFELGFLQDGGYGRSTRAPWRAPAIFEDSPICPNFCDPAHSHPCETCLLEQFVPEELKKEASPCRFICVSKDGRTIEDLYRTGSQAEIEEALEGWLRAQIARIEQERGLSAGAAGTV